jgi:hypothetical protein
MAFRTFSRLFCGDLRSSFLPAMSVRENLRWLKLSETPSPVRKEST